MKTLVPTLLIVFSLTCFAFLRNSQAVVPAPDGGYAGGNTAEGQNALVSVTPTGIYNTALGFSALESNTGGDFNTATGAGALLASTASDNTATRAAALFADTSGDQNAANGAFALFKNTIGSFNTATGLDALFANTTGNSNSAFGQNAMVANDTGTHNTACGIGALAGNTTGGFNIALGSSAGANLTTGSNNIEIGHAGFAGEHGTIRIGDSNHIGTFIDGIYAVDEGTPAVPVYVSSGGQLGTQPPPSSRRFKKQIKPMDSASEAILGLKPVTFQYKSDNMNTPQFGLIAEEVAAVNPDLVVRDKNGEIYTVRYDAVNAMLPNEFLKEHRKVE